MKYFLLCDDFRSVPDIAFDGQHPISQEGSLWADNTGKPGPGRSITWFGPLDSKQMLENIGRMGVLRTAPLPALRPYTVD